MDLWTDYEGKTIAGRYQLATLLQSEGRSAFFRVSPGDQEQAVLRLTEAHYDQAEMLQRWKHVAEVQGDHLLAIRDMGETTLDGVALTYAVLEPNDGNLAEVLQERPLTTAETMDVAQAVVDALSALHRIGMVHEHIEPSNVFAVGETVKLRSDCVRECVIDQEFSTAEDCRNLRQRDVHDLGVLLLRCLTLSRYWQHGIALPQPFMQIVPRAIDGSWGLAQIAAALEQTTAPPVNAVQHATATLAAPGSQQDRDSKEAALELPEALRQHLRNGAGHLNLQSGRLQPWLSVAAIVLVVLVLWYFFAGSSRRAPAVNAESVTTSALSAPAGAVSPAVRAEEPPPATAPEEPASIAAAATRAGAASSGAWHVVAYTYNREAQAAARAAQVARQHASFAPQVFSPSGHAPWFVALGGGMTSGEAASMLRSARHAGLPRDTFMRNF